MATDPTPGPGEPSGLSPRERAILADIEGDLSASDPDLAKSLSSCPTMARWRSVPRALRWTAMALLGLLTFLIAVVVVPASGWAVLMLIALFVLPWTLLRRFENNDPS
jgi:Flp pilus assembly protein TadB